MLLKNVNMMVAITKIESKKPITWLKNFRHDSKIFELKLTLG